MPKQIFQSELSAWGISQKHERMDNGELRFRLMGRDGSGYIRCENPGPPVWENGHSHSSLQELVLVQHGAVVFVELRGKETKFTLLQEGDWAVTTPQVPHTECVGGNAVVHTIKFGDCSNSDWIPSLELDAKTKSLSFEEACQKCQSR